MKQRNKRPTKLLWIDLEMTGLDPVKQKIIEVGLVITDFDFNELATYEAIIKQPEAAIEGADNWVKDNFGPNGFLDEVRSSKTTEAQVVSDIKDLIGKHFDAPAILAGSSIHQDRRFIRQWWPEIEALLHYRMLDVTTMKIYMMGKYSMYHEKSENHRALEDIRGSIDEFKAYLGSLESRANPEQ